jgi:hypothetical protein
MKEIRNLNLTPEDIYCNYGFEYEEPLLEYVEIIAEEYKPSTPEECENGQYISRAINDFAFRYLSNKIDKVDKVVKTYMTKYLENTDVQQTIKSMGYDVNRFWYLLMFIYDYSSGFYRYGINQNDEPKEQILKLIKGIAENISGEDEYDNPIFIKPAQLILKMPNKNITINNPIALAWLAAILNNELEKIENGSKMATSITKLKTINGQFENNPKSQTAHIWYFTKMFLKFFELRPPPIKASTKKGSTISLNKLLLISRLVFITNLSTNKNYLDSEDNLKGCRPPENFDLNMINGFYL